MLTVEDGRNRDFANTYADLACADAYLVPRGLWPATAIEVDTEAGTETPNAVMIQAKERALIRAFDWLNSLDWLGEPLDWEQQAAWPRSGVPVPGQAGKFIPDDIVPRAVIQAQLEMAGLVFNDTDLFAPLERGGRITSESHSRSEGNLDVIGGDSQSDSYTYSEAAPAETYYPAVAGLLAPYLAKIPGKANGFQVLDVGRG